MKGTLFNKFEVIQRILFDINVATNHILELDKRDDFIEIKLNPFFRNYRYQSIFISIIQLSKLLNKDERFSFISVTNGITDKHYKKEINLRLIENRKFIYGNAYRDISEIIADVKIIRNEIELKTLLIEKLIGLRDKVYAHTDYKQPPWITIQEIIELRDMVNKYFKLLHNKLYAIDVDIKNTYDWNINGIIKSLSDELSNKLRKYDEPNESL